MYTCAECGRIACDSGDAEGYPRDCPSREPGREELLALYRDGEDRHLARNAALVEAHGYCRLTRIEEIMDFARRCGFSRLGIACCVGLLREAAIVGRVLRANGFSVDSVACKNATCLRRNWAWLRRTRSRRASSRPCALPSAKRELLRARAPS